MRRTQEARVSRKQERQAGQECVQSYRHQHAHINMHTESVHMHFDRRTLIHAFACCRSMLNPSHESMTTKA